MTAIAFDTLAYVKTLRDAGMEEKQAEAQAIALSAVLKDQSGSVATKAEISDLKRDNELLKAEMKRDMAEVKAELVKWVVGVGILQTTLIVGILARLAKVI